MTGAVQPIFSSSPHNDVESPLHPGPVRPWRSSSGGGAAASRRGYLLLCATGAALLLLMMLVLPELGFHVSGASEPIPSLQSDGAGTPTFQLSRSNGICRLEYTVKTWDGINAPACDPSLCASRDELTELHDLKPLRRWSAYDEGAYLGIFNNISGWLQTVQVNYVKKFTQKQLDMGIYGAVGEIGVHHGKFLIPIVGNALVEEPAVAIDLFEDQDANVDKSGKGSMAALLRNLEASGIPNNSITLMGGNSMLLSARNFTSRGFPAFRLISVDGGHTLEITLHDMMVASCLVRDGGLIVLDDFPNPTWIGVSEALMHFSHVQDRLIPFMHGYNKVWFATASHVQLYRDLVARDNETFTCKPHHDSRRTIAGHVLCYTGPHAW